MAAGYTPDHYDGRLFLYSRAHSCCMGERPSWELPSFWPSRCLPPDSAPMVDVELEIIVCLAVQDRLMEPWKSLIFLDRKEALPVDAWRWLGKCLSLTGTLEVWGEPREREEEVKLVWSGRQFEEPLELPSGGTLKALRWKADVFYGPRRNLELMGIGVRLLRWVLKAQ